MKKLLICLMLLPAAGYAQQPSRAELEALPARGAEAAPAPRPDAQKVLAQISAELRLSSKQEERISAAVSKKGAEFDKLMKEYEKNLAEEKKWRYKMNESRYELVRISRELPATVREFLDDEQREAFDEMLASKGRPAAAPAAEVREAAPAAEAPKPAKKRKLVKRKRVKPAAAPAPKAAAPAAKPAPEPEAEAEEPAAQETPAEEEDPGSYP